MFETRFQTYWADTDAAGIVYFPHFFRFVEQAEEELFRASGQDVRQLMEKHGLLFPRVEAFSKFVKPVPWGGAIRVQLKPELSGLKTIRHNFEIIDDQGGEKLAAGYITVVCVDKAKFKSTPLPDEIRHIIQNA